MRLSSICLSLCLLAPSVLANVLAGPYQVWDSHESNAPRESMIAANVVCIERAALVRLPDGCDGQ